MTAPPARSRVLVAEDDPALRALLLEVLEADGYYAIALADGRELHGQLLFDGFVGGTLPDVVVTDLNMPGRNGLDVVDAMRRRGWFVPVVLLSAFVDEDVRARARGLGRCTVLDKPFELDALREAIRLCHQW